MAFRAQQAFTTQQQDKIQTEVGRFFVNKDIPKYHNRMVTINAWSALNTAGIPTVLPAEVVDWFYQKFHRWGIEIHQRNVEIAEEVVKRESRAKSLACTTFHRSDQG